MRDESQTLRPTASDHCCYNSNDGPILPIFTKPFSAADEGSWPFCIWKVWETSCVQGRKGVYSFLTCQAK